jgi:hypothetical protein
MRVRVPAFNSGTWRRWRLSRPASVAAALVLLVGVVAPAGAASPSPGEWHRNNYNNGHERLTCREGSNAWSCVYDQLPEEGVPVGDGTAHFSGPNVVGSWTCPEWFDASVCDHVVAVYRGNATYVSSNGHPVTFAQEQIVTHVDGTEVLQQYFVDLFYCPWYRTFAEALAHDFNCTFAP